MYTLEDDIKWKMYSNNNYIIFQYNPNESIYKVYPKLDTINIDEVKTIPNVSNKLYSFKLAFNGSVFLQSYEFFGIQLIYSDSPIDVIISYESKIEWNLIQNPEVVIPFEELQKGLIITIDFTLKPREVIFKIFPINNGLSVLNESSNFGINVTN